MWPRRWDSNPRPRISNRCTLFRCSPEIHVRSKLPNDPLKGHNGSLICPYYLTLVFLWISVLRLLGVKPTQRFYSLQAMLRKTSIQSKPDLGVTVLTKSASLPESFTRMFFDLLASPLSYYVIVHCMVFHHTSQRSSSCMKNATCVWS